MLLRKLNNIGQFCLALIAMVWLSACASVQKTSIAQIENLPNTFSVPYRISDAGHMIVDVSINNGPTYPFIIDTGANISAVYAEYVETMNLTASDDGVSVKGLVSTDVRPSLENVNLTIGPEKFHPDSVISLETQDANNDAIGLLGLDVLSTYTVLFNRTSLMASFIPSQQVASKDFKGWKRIPLRNRVGSFPDNGLYFATTILKDKKVPILIDTGSDLNFINWPLATMDEDFEKVQRRLQSETYLVGATDSKTLRLKTKFFDLTLGNYNWPEVDIIVMEFDTFTTIAPVDRPFMIAGAPMFAPSTFAFDFAGNRLYIYE